MLVHKSRKTIWVEHASHVGGMRSTSHIVIRNAKGEGQGEGTRHG